MNPIRVLVLTTSYPVRDDSVSGIFVKQLIDNLPDEIDTLVLTPADSKSTKLSEGRVIPCKYAPRTWQTLAHNPGGIPVALQKNRFGYFLIPFLLSSMFIHCLFLGRSRDVIHANWAICGLIAGICGTIIRKKVVTTLRGEDINRATNSAISKLILKVCIGLSDSIVCVSSSHSKSLKKLYPTAAHKIQHIPNGVSSELLSSSPNPGNNDSVTILTIGSLIPRKNISCIIEAISKCRCRNRIRLKIVGEGPLKQALDLSTKTLGVQTEFKGQVDFRNIGKEYQSSDIFILASFSEGRPNVMLEAMASGLTVICSDIPGTNEVITQNSDGILFELDNRVSLANAIDTACESTEFRNRLGSNAKAYILKNQLTWQHTGSTYASLYRSMIEGNA